MARVGTTFLNIGQWVDGENPGSGAQGVDNTGLNGNWIKLDTAVGTQHNTDGTHKTDVIDGTNLKTTAADGSTLELAGSPLKLRIKDVGVTTAKLADDSVDANKLKDDASTDANRAVTTNHIRDSAVTTAKIANDAVTTAKIATDAVTTAKILNANVTTAKLEYKEFVALVNQAGVGNPVATIIKNTLSGTPAWAWTATGVASVTLSGEWTLDKTLFLITPAQGTFTHLQGRRLDVSNLEVRNFDAAGAGADNYVGFVLIRVYP